jgi:TolB-like protein
MARVLVLLLAALLMASCATVQTPQTGEDYSDDIRQLLRRLAADPSDPVALREIGIRYFLSKQFDLAKLNLYRAYLQQKDDPKTMFYYGLTLEYMGDIQGALGIYINYTDVSALSSYRKLLEGRYRALTREIIKQQFQSLLANEQQLGADRLVPKAVAVFPLTYQGTDPKFEALGKGISEMLLIDLGQIKNLTIIERIRIEALLEELKFGQSKFVDKTTAPRLGKLLSAGRVVSGSFNVSNEKLRMDVAAWDVAGRKFPDFKSQTDDLENLFKIEKELVFTIIRDLGITLTQEERQRIQFIPTKNILAFMNYCMGLKSEDAYDYQAAKVYYNEALTLDPSFDLAKTKAAAAEALSAAGGSKESALLAAQKDDPTQRLRKSRINLVLGRFNNLRDGVGTLFLPGQDDRKPIEELDQSGFGVDLLPEPPPPPPR